MGIKFEPYAKAEWFEQFVNTHTTATNSLRIRTTERADLEITGIIVRKTSGTGSGVPMKLEVYELETPTTGGTAFTENPSPVDREQTVSPSYEIVQNPTYSLTNAKIMFRERMGAEKTFAGRVQGYGIKYYLKPNTDYLILSTVESGTDYNIQTVLAGLWRDLNE